MIYIPLIILQRLLKPNEMKKLAAPVVPKRPERRLPSAPPSYSLFIPEPPGGP